MHMTCQENTVKYSHSVLVIISKNMNEPNRKWWTHDFYGQMMVISVQKYMLGHFLEKFSGNTTNKG